MKFMARDKRETVTPGKAWSPRSTWVLMCFAVFTVLMGGGARYDLASLPVLRAAAVFLAFSALAIAPLSVWRGVRFPLALLGAMAIWMAVQLLPLPPALWSALPLRAPILEMDTLLGVPDRWRPITLTPAYTWNSLLALWVPIGALLIAGALPSSERIRIWWIVWACGLASAAFGLLQFMAGPRSPFYLYRITNEGALVGLFANRNHNAVLLAIGILAAGWLVANEVTRRNPRPLMVPALIGSIVIFLLLIFAVGSRTGLVCGIGSALVAYMVVRRSYRLEPKLVNQVRDRRQVERRLDAARFGRLRRVLLTAFPFFMVGLLTVLFYLSGRGNSVIRLFGSDAAEDGRIMTLAPILSLLKEQWLFGSGFGSFARVYQIIEPDSLLQEAYLNQAHNDWLQFPIEAGIPGTIIFIMGIAWVLAQLFGSSRDRSKRRAVLAAEMWTVAASFAVLALGSLTDYPLRVPSMSMIAMFLVVILVRHREAVSAPDPAVNRSLS